MAESPTLEPRDDRTIVFYDGGCGLCHKTVLYLIEEDARGQHFRFAPIEGETFLERVPEDQREGLPDSVVLLEPDGRLRVKSDAMLTALETLGGRHATRARILRALPSFLVDAGYAVIASLRRRLWKKPDHACPIVPPDLRARFAP